jgi:dolichol-phosphate mannosyltransferase
MQNYSPNQESISVVTPCFNEEAVLALFYEQLIKVLERLGLPYELIFVNDGSRDNSVHIIKELNRQNPKTKLVSLSRNFGHQIATMAGLHYASGSCSVVLDADLQDPPEVIEKMVEKWRKGYDVVYGVRRQRKESKILQFCYRVFYILLQKLSFVHIPRDVGDFCLMDNRVVRQMRRLSEERPFVRGLRSWVGFKQIGIEYERAGRIAGHTKYNFRRLFRLAFDGIFSFSNVILRVATVFGLMISLLSIVYAVYIGVNRIRISLGLIDSSRLIPGWATLTCSIMFLLGLQFIFFGILGEYIGRIFAQVKRRPLFVVDEELGFGKRT